MARKTAAFFLSAFFLLGTWKGYVALWVDDTPIPRKVFPYCVSSLPQKDQQALKQGIRAETPEILTKRLEDFLS